MNFFLDNTVGGGQGEFADGRIALLRLYDSVLTSSDVSMLADDPFESCPVPEPATLLLIGSGLVGFGLLRRRRSISKMKTTGILIILVLMACAFFITSPGYATTISIDPRRTFLRTNNDSEMPSIPIELVSLDLTGGNVIRLEELGDFDAWGTGLPVNDIATGMIGVFSSSNTVLGSWYLNRVQGAIDAGSDVITAPTASGNIATDIVQDFRITDITIEIPIGARYLFVSANDNRYNDNKDPDGDFAVRITSIPVPEPATYLLFGMGIGGLWLYRRVRGLK